MGQLTLEAHLPHPVPAIGIDVPPSRAVKSAVISDCGRYRYLLSRVWCDSLPCAVFVGMNPSRADGLIDDMTVTKEKQFAVQLGAGALVKVNRYAWRTTYPVELRKALDDGEDIVGPENLFWIKSALRPDTSVGRLVAAWGSHKLVREGGPSFADWLSNFREVLCLGKTSDGEPRHPSRLAYATPFEVLRPFQGEQNR